MTLRINADFNDLVRGVRYPERAAVVVDSMGALRSLAQARVRMSEGMPLIAVDWSDDDEHRVVHGLASYDYDGSRWLIEFDDAGVSHVAAAVRGKLDQSLPCVACGDLCIAGEPECRSCGTRYDAPLAAPACAGVMRLLDEALLPPLREYKAALENAHPDSRFSLRAHRVGQATGYQAYSINLECILPNIPGDQADLVGLGITIKHITTVPTFACADVCWGHPSGHIEDELEVDDVEWSADLVEQIVAGLPRLVMALTAAISRGRSV